MGFCIRVLKWRALSLASLGFRGLLYCAYAGIKGFLPYHYVKMFQMPSSTQLDWAANFTAFCLLGFTLLNNLGVPFLLFGYILFFKVWNSVFLFQTQCLWITL